MLPEDTGHCQRSREALDADRQGTDVPLALPARMYTLWVQPHSRYEGRRMAKKNRKKTTNKNGTKSKAIMKSTERKTRRKFTPQKKAEIISAVDAARRGSKEAVYDKYGVAQTQVSRWRTGGFGKKRRKKATRRKISKKSRVLSEYREVKATLLARKKELEAELKEINAALKG